MPGRVVAIHVAAHAGAPMEAVSFADCREDFGLVGDRYARAGSRGQVTIVAQELLDEAAAEWGAAIGPGSTRRNVTIAGIALPPIGGRLGLGDVVLEITGPAEPCGLMDECIGEGAKSALVGRAGVRSRVVRGGRLSVDDSVQAVGPAQAAGPATAAER
jgi:MOSC domain-containing protein YiiM